MQPRTGVPYPSTLREGAVRRYLNSEVSYRDLAAEIGVSPCTLRNWVKQHKSGVMARRKADLPQATDDRSAQEKLALLLKARALPDGELGEFLRSEGIREGDLERWEHDALGGLQRGPSDDSKGRQIRELERRADKSEKRLKEANALLELQKKVQALWVDEDDDTSQS